MTAERCRAIELDAGLETARSRRRAVTQRRQRSAATTGDVLSPPAPGGVAPLGLTSRAPPFFTSAPPSWTDARSAASTPKWIS